MKPINLIEKQILFTKTWHPHQIAIVDDMQVILAKLQGEFVWHSHEHEDELFQVLKGILYMQFRDKTEVVYQGEIIVAPKGVEHCPMTKNNEVVEVLLFEKLTTAHTGNVQHKLSQNHYPKI
jgi:mannose-6-phosphate isomerase-like protein (cupin superfamily)